MSKGYQRVLHNEYPVLDRLLMGLCWLVFIGGLIWVAGVVR